MAKLGVTQLEQAAEIPNGSLHLVEMGDGSGTKAVTQETLVKETGKALKLGNLEELQTENKTSLVAAINEATQSGGGGTPVDILDTQEEIEANTEAGKAAGALAVKEMFGALNDNLSLFWSDYINNETNITNLVASGYTVPYNCKVIYSITKSSNAAEGGFPTATIYLNGVTCKSHRGEVQDEALWVNTILLKKGDTIKISLTRSKLEYAKMYSI